MKSQKKTYPLIYKYLEKYQEDPTSRIFAPLAEAYRRAGLIDAAIEVAREGLAIHPHFMSGRVALARALFEKKDYSAVIEELSPIVKDIPDNLVAQRLLAESYLVLGFVTESLSAYKMLLYFSPQDLEAARLVQELEVQAYEKGTLVLRSDPPLPVFDIKPVQGAIDASPEVSRNAKIRKIEKLQSVLQKIERYRVLSQLQ